jgi:hypothetical protein
MRGEKSSELTQEANQSRGCHPEADPVRGNPSKLRELAAWYREFAERAGNPSIWEARLRIMALIPSVIHVEKPAGTSLSEYFGEMRTWLDTHKITPVEFHLSGGYSIDLYVSFSSPHEANLFQRKFVFKDQPTTVLPLIFADLAAPQPSITRTVSINGQRVRRRHRRREMHSERSA